MTIGIIFATEPSGDKIDKKKWMSFDIYYSNFVKKKGKSKIYADYFLNTIEKEIIELKNIL